MIWPSNPGSTQPAFWMKRPILPMEERPSTKAVMLSGTFTYSWMVASRKEWGGMVIYSPSISRYLISESRVMMSILLWSTTR